MSKKTQNPQSNIGAVSTSGGYNSGNGRCKKCGKPFVYVGDVPDGGFMEGLEPYCTCNVKKQTAGMYGWICPNCVFMSGGHKHELNINRKLSARLHKHAVSGSFLWEQ